MLYSTSLAIHEIMKEVVSKPGLVRDVGYIDLDNIPI